MMTIFSRKNILYLLAGLLLPVFSVVNYVRAADFDPFGDVLNQAEVSTPEAEEQGPVIPEMQFGDSDISMVFQIISDATGWSIFPTDEVSKTKISLWAKDITAKELLDKVVKLAGYIYHRQGNVITVMTYDQYAQFYGLARKVIPLTYGDAGSIAGVIKPFLTKIGKIVVHRETNAIVLYEAEGNLEFIADIIKKLDVPTGKEMVIEIIDLEFADAEVLAEAVKNIFPDKKPKNSYKDTDKEELPDDSNAKAADSETHAEGFLSVPQSQTAIYPIGRTNQLVIKASRDDIEKIKKLVEKLDVYIEPTTKNYHFTYVDAAEIYKGLERILNISDRYDSSDKSGGSSRQNRGGISGSTLVEKTNSILLTAPPSVHRIMASIVESIDLPGTYETGMIKVYKIENADVDEVAKTIEKIIENQDDKKEKYGEVRFSKDSPGGGSADQESGGVASTEEFVPRIEGRVSVNKSTNSIVVQATARQHRQLQELIEELDIRQKQVLIEAMIVEVATSDNMDLGMELGNAGDDGFAFSSFGLSTDLDPTMGNGKITISPGGTAAILRSGEVRAILHALKSEGGAKVTASPQILVNDNSVGYINSVAEEPITQVNASDTVATTSFGGFVEAGTQFAITPHISEANSLRVEYQITLNSFGTKPTDSSIPPPRNTSSIQSQATVPDGFTIVVGGLQTSNESENVDKVPFLGDIPVIGLAFRNTAVKKKYKTTYLFITPTIMRAEDFVDIKNVSTKALEEVK